MTIHATAITFHDCRIHLEPIGPEPAIAEQRYRFQVEHCASTEAILGTAISQWVIGTKPPRKCQHCSGTIEGGGFVIVGGGVMHHECFREAMTSAKKPADRIAEPQEELAQVRASLQAMAEQSATYMRERDEARANLQKLLDRRIDGIPGPPWPTDLVAEVKRLRAAMQAVVDMPPVQCGVYSYPPFVNGKNQQQERIQGELRKALG